MPPPAPILLYCKKEDVTSLGIGKSAVKSIEVGNLEAPIEPASRVIDSYLRKAMFPETITPRYVLPLIRVGSDIKECCAVLVAWRVLKVVGFNANVPAHELLRLDYEDKIKWLEGIAAGKVSPDVDDSSDPAVVVEPEAPGGTPMVVTNQSRGWQDRGGGAFTGWRR